MFYNTHDLLEMEVELIEDKVIEDQTLDIDSIKEINTSGCLVDTSTLKINQLIQAIKHLNKEIQSIKEK